MTSNIERPKLEDLKNLYQPSGTAVIVIDGYIYDITKFRNEHPGGSEIIDDYLYSDATDAFNDIGHSLAAKQYLAKLKIGTIFQESQKTKEIVVSEDRSVNSEKEQGQK
jgi:cytochrome b involved in lipid metabolism